MISWSIPMFSIMSMLLQLLATLGTSGILQMLIAKERWPRREKSKVAEEAAAVVWRTITTVTATEAVLATVTRAPEKAEEDVVEDAAKEAAR